MRLSFHGADREVTGCCHLLQCLERNILIDCGMRQGSRELAQENAEPFGFDPAAIDVVLLTHAHLDHCGRLPLLTKRGFKGEIIATAATRDLARLVIVDAAHLHEEEAERGARHHRRHDDDGSSEPIYSLLDAFSALGQFGRAAAYNVPIDLVPGIRATFFDAGHILGSASILIEVVDQRQSRSVLFSGDIGNAGRPLLRPPATPAKADFIVMESIYGDRLHRPKPGSIEEFYSAIADSFARGGNAIIPTFALERAQEILYLLHHGIDGNLRYRDI
jgi:metallo-beta-lactamase family protein